MLINFKNYAKNGNCYYLLPNASSHASSLHSFSTANNIFLYKICVKIVSLKVFCYTCLPTGAAFCFPHHSCCSLSVHQCQSGCATAVSRWQSSDSQINLITHLRSSSVQQPKVMLYNYCCWCWHITAAFTPPLTVCFCLPGKRFYTLFATTNVFTIEYLANAHLHA